MSESLALLARCVVIGVAVAAPVGAIGVLCIQRTLAGGWHAGVATGLGVATADALYASVAAFGVSAISSTLVSAQTPLRVAGGIALIYLGARSAIGAWRTTAGSPASAPPPPAVSMRSVFALYGSAVALTLTNPMTIMAFVAVFAGAGLSVAPGFGAAATATAGVFVGSLCWWAILVSTVATMRHAIGSRTQRVIGVVSGAAIAVFGFVALVGALD